MSQPKEKFFKTYGAQLKGLKERGLNITPVIQSKRILQNENYYNVINGYSKLFLKNEDSEEYIDGVSLKEIYALYNFDRNLRALYLKQVLKLENYFKSIIAYDFSKKYGHKDKEYLKIENFKEMRKLHNL